MNVIITSSCIPLHSCDDIIFVFSPTAELDVSSFSNQSSADIQSAVDHAILEAVSDGRVGNLKTVPNSVRVGAPEAQKGALHFVFLF